MAYRESFYRFLMTQRNPGSADDNAQHDSSFPKQEEDYEKLSDYLELNAGYLPSMSVFDKAYQLYLDNMN